jgi:hypothetical protein
MSRDGPALETLDFRDSAGAGRAVQCARSCNGRLVHFIVVKWGTEIVKPAGKTPCLYVQSQLSESMTHSIVAQLVSAPSSIDGNRCHGQFPFIRNTKVEQFQNLLCGNVSGAPFRDDTEVFAAAGECPF